MNRFLIIACILFLSLLVTPAVFAVDQNSASFKNNDSTFAPAAANVRSTNFKVSGSMDAIVGASVSPGFGIQSGVPIPPGTVPVPTPPPGSGSGEINKGGGGTATVGYVVPPTFTFKTPTFKSEQLIKGTRGSRDTTILVNGSPDGVTYPSDSTWEWDVPLILGANVIIVQGRIPSGYVTPTIGGTIARLLIGDVNRDFVVNDEDLSLFVRGWKRYNPFADFDEDGKIDDIDLSLLASHWGMKQSIGSR